MLIRFNKPYGALTQFRDKDGRPTLADYIRVPNVYPAGRLDHDSEGLLLLTDDGVLQHRLSDPAHKLPKTYWAQVEGEPDVAAIDQLRRGVLIDGQRTLPAQVRRVPEPALWPRDPPIRFRKNIPTAWLEIVLTEGRNRQVRRMTAAVGHPTLRLVRVAIGPYTIEDLPPGEWRPADTTLLKWRHDLETERGGRGDRRARGKIPAGRGGGGRRGRAQSTRRPSR
jgi:23S rRNA pseudouridine2457 synthase